MAEYIKREDVLTHKRKMRCADFRGGFLDFIVRCEDIERIPAADVEEVRHGFWVPVMQGRERAWACNECKTLGSQRWKRCPVCEAKMGGGDDNENTGNS